jgi:hypothetical protein
MDSFDEGCGGHQLYFANSRDLRPVYIMMGRRAP